MNKNIILLSDSYKVSHKPQYPKDTTEVYSYFESRGGKFNSVLFFGLQYFLKEYLEGQVLTKEKIKQAEKILVNHLPSGVFNNENWYRLLEKHNGYLPIEIKAVPEGTVVPVSNVLMTVRNTDPEFYWLTNYLETLLVQVWYPSTVATYSMNIKNNIKKFLHDTSTSNVDSIIGFMLNDFGVRGSTSPESAMIGGAAHLINFIGTDNINALNFIQEYYNSPDYIGGYSIPASEHSTITAWGKEHEVDAYRNMLEQYPSGMLACVSDSYDIYNACWELWGTELRDMVLNRDGVLVIRPDSGDPIAVTLKVINILGDRFGYTTNDLSYKVLNPKVRIIQGDGIDINMINDILNNFKNNKWSSENIVFGSGGALLQKHDRDTLKFAFKCSNVIVDGEDVAVFKNPITDPGKMSKKGKNKLVKVGTSYDTVPEWADNHDELQTVFLNGKIQKEYTFAEVINNVR